MHNLIQDGVVFEQFEKRPALHRDMRIVDDGGQPGVAVGWIYKLGKFSPPPARQVPKTRLFDYAEDHVGYVLSLHQSYKIDGFDDPLIDDVGTGTVVNLQKISAALSVGAIKFPFLYSDELYKRWSMTEAQLRQYLSAAFARYQSVWQFYNEVVIDAIQTGAVTTEDEIDALAWPKGSPAEATM